MRHPTIDNSESQNMDAIEKAIAQMNSQSGDSTQVRSTHSSPRPERLVPVQKLKVRSANDEQAAHHPVRQFTLPHKEFESQSMIEVAGTRNKLSEEYRAIKRPILYAMDDAKDLELERSNIIMVSSSVSGEGKTFSAINLAISIAMERDRSVLLVDGDVTNPSAGKKLGFKSAQIGLTDVLVDPTLSVSDVIWQSDIPSLRFLPAGSSVKNVTELLSSRAMHRMIQELSDRYQDQVIVFDSAPMLLTSESGAVADLAGQIVFVVGAESTTRGMVSDALKMIKDHSRVGFILNKTRKKQNNIYGYGYGYGHNYN